MNLACRFIAAFALFAVHTTRLLGAVPEASCAFDTFSAPDGFTLSQVNGVGDDGTVVGQLVNNKTKEFAGFRRSAEGVITILAAPNALTTWFYGRSGSGVDAGFYQDREQEHRVHGFLLTNGNIKTVDYPKAANTWIFQQNLLGTSVGSFRASPTVIKGFRFVNGKFTTIAYPGALATYPMSINDEDEVVGTYSNSPVSNGFIWKAGVFTDVSFPQALLGTVLTGVNNLGVIVGNYIESDNDFGFILESGRFKRIVYPEAKATMAGGINNNSLISGGIYLTGQTFLGYTAVCH